MEPKYIVCREDLEHNIRILKEKAKGKLIWGVVKGNGYGLGIGPLVQILNDCGIDHFAVTSLAEAQAVRDAGMTHHPILMLRGSTDPEEVEGLLKLGVTLSLGSRADTELLEEIAAQLDVVAKVHVEMDTGMGRYGFTSDERIWVDAIYHEVYPHIRPIGLYTHFHTAGKRWQVLQQVNRFQWTLERLRLHGDDPGMIHYCNSIAFWKYPKYHENAVRLGSAILGRVYYGRKAGLRRVGWVEAPIQEVKHLYRDSNVGYGNACKVSRGHDLAVVGVGYFHGFGVERGYDVFRIRDCLHGMARYLKYMILRRRLTVTIHGKTCRVLGHVGMLNLVADVTGLKCQPGDLVTIQINPLDLKGMEIEYR